MEAEPGGGRRFRDPGVRLWHFAREILVRCPRCDARALVAVHPGHRDGHTYAVGWLTAPHRLTCPACGHVAAWTPQRWRVGAGDAYFTPRGVLAVPAFGGADDPYFGLPLWLRRSCCGRVLWAYNAAHLELLEAYAAATLRERPRPAGSQSMLERLPAWMKSAGNRAEVLAAIRALRDAA
ncbi:hypothetical protein E1292_28190 [Nonomuraea deserti]|uniref:TFIIB-type zinc ribbon-containing protein n=1 Tax=Nonomuraea deserti TaxID=1848322 RepID=A0A4V2Y9P7_9ACTN|nr:hypothetical protein [Nonomuraea deserti]TDD00626.1 hypothetical protein E1292_28190 [Nonomuraea deserti]